MLKRAYIHAAVDWKRAPTYSIECATLESMSSLTSAAYEMPTEGALPVPRSVRERERRFFRPFTIDAIESRLLTVSTGTERAFLSAIEMTLIEFCGLKSLDQCPSATRVPREPSLLFQYGGKETITGVRTSSSSSLYEPV